MTWDEDVARQGTEAIYDGIYWAATHAPCGDLTGCESCREQARGAWTQVAPFVAAEVARAEARGKVAALREAAEWFRKADKALREPDGVPAPWLAAARRLDHMAAIEAEAGER